METKVCVYYFFCHQLSLLDTCKNTFTVFPKDVPPIVTIILSNLYQFWNSFTAGNFIKFPAKQSVTLAITPKTCCRLATLPQEPYSKCSVFFVAVFAYYTAHKYCFSGVCLCVWLSVCVRATNDKLPVTDWCNLMLMIIVDVSGPSNWHQTYPTCAGSAQSPVNIDRSQVVFSSSLTTFDIPGYETIPRGAHWQLHNSGHTGEMSICNCSFAFLCMCNKLQ